MSREVPAAPYARRGDGGSWSDVVVRAGGSVRGAPAALPAAARTSRALLRVALAACRLIPGLRLRRFRVEGSSMEPTYRAGDWLLAVPLRSPRIGAVVAVRDPDELGRWLVKRVSSFWREGASWHGLVQGDNTGASRDSRHFGSVELSGAWRVVCRYGSDRGR